MGKFIVHIHLLVLHHVCNHYTLLGLIKKRPSVVACVTIEFVIRLLPCQSKQRKQRQNKKINYPFSIQYTPQHPGSVRALSVIFVKM